MENIILSKYKIIEVYKNEYKSVFSYVAIEKAIKLFINNEEYVTFMCTPSNIKELVFGFLYNSGIIDNICHIQNFIYDEKESIVNLLINQEIKSNKLQTKFPNNAIEKKENVKNYENSLTITKELILKNLEWFQSSSDTYKLSKSVHSAAISSKGEMPQTVLEDVARHNVFDKVIGYALLNNYDLKESIIFCTSRVSTEIINKAIMSQISMLVSLKPATTNAIDNARKYGLTLITCSKDNKLYILSSMEKNYYNEN